MMQMNFVAKATWCGDVHAQAESIQKASTLKLGGQLFIAALSFVTACQAFALSAIGTVTPAKLEVTPSGSAAYTIPIAVPAGIGGLQPSIALHYDSQAGRGIAGPGWTLQGIDAIRRCQQTRAQAGVKRGINLTSDDHFCLNGARLELDASLTYYRTELDNFARVKAQGTAGTGPASFTVETKEGQWQEFGLANGSAVIPGPVVTGGAAPTTVVAWSIDKVKDRTGNVINYTYATDAANGSQVLSKIDYNSGNAYIKFVYEDDLDPATAFLAGTRLTNSKLLKDIYTYVLDDAAAEKLVKHYVLGYDKSDLKGDSTKNPISRLTSVVECGADGTCVNNALLFGWNSWAVADAKFDASVALLSGNALTKSGRVPNEMRWKRTFADLNGDGKMDVIAFLSDGVYAEFSTPNVGASNYSSNLVQLTTDFDSDTYWRDESVFTGFLPRHMVDMNGDGFPDIVGFHPDVGKLPGSNPAGGPGIYMALWDPVALKYKPMTKVTGGASKYVSPGWGRTICDGELDDIVAPRYIVDMDDDGFPDIVGIANDGTWMSHWNGTSFDAPRLVSSAFRIDSGYLTGDCMGVDRQPVYLADMNADGFPDIVSITMNGAAVMLWDPSGTDAQGNVGVFKAPQTMSTEFRSSYRKDTLYPTWLIDMNGDGYPDLVNFSSSGIKVSLWTGTSFVTSTTWTSEFATNGGTDLSHFPRRIIDMNGDGYPDVVEFRSDGVYVALSNGQGRIFSATKWTAEFPANTKDAYSNSWGLEVNTPRHVVDLNGDGVPDILGFGDQSVRWASPHGAAGTRITSISDTLGAKTSIQYTVATDSSGFYASDAPGSLPAGVQGVHAPQLVVSEVSVDDGYGGQRKLRYRYGGLNNDFNRGSLGFRTMAVLDPLTHIDSQTVRSQTYPFVGMELSQELHQNSNLLVDSAVSGCADASTALCFRAMSISAGSLVSKTTNTLQKEQTGTAAEYPALGSWFPYLQSSVETRYELDGSQLPTKTTTFAYEEPRQVQGAKQWGNLTGNTVSFSDGNSVATANTFEPAIVSTWTLGRKSSSVVTTSRPARTINVAAPTDAPPPPQAAGPLPATTAVIMQIITSILLSD